MPSTYADISSCTVLSLDLFGQHFHIPVLVQGSNRTARVSAMIDSGATALFLSHKFAAKHHIPFKKLPHTIKVSNIDGTANKAGSITHFARLHLIIGKHKE